MSTGSRCPIARTGCRGEEALRLTYPPGDADASAKQAAYLAARLLQQKAAELMALSEEKGAGE